MKLRDIVLWAALTAILAGILYAPAGSFGFLHLDDHDYTFRCPFVFDGLSWGNVKEAFANVRHGGVWMPLTYISYMADITLFGPGPGAHHLVNVALHMANIVLLVIFAWRLAERRQDGSDVNGGRGRGFWIVLAVAFWALHPQRVEAVAWIAGRKELLWAGFTLAGLLCWGRGTRGVLGAYLFCALACMSKPTAMCLPLLALCVDMAGRKGIRTDTAPTVGHMSRSHMDLLRELRSRLPAYLPLVLMALATGAIAIYSQTHPEGHEVRELFSASLPWRLLNAAVAIGLYIFQMVVPVGIHLDYRAVPGQWPLHGLLGCMVFAGCLALVAWRLYRGARDAQSRARGTRAPTGACVLWFLAALLPTLGIFGSFGEHARADRFLYVPMMAVAMAAAMAERAVGAWTNRRLKERWPEKIAACLYVVGVAVAAWPVIDSYRSDETAFARTLAFDPDNGRALAHVGQAECARRGGIDRGIGHLRRSQAVRPRDDTAAQLAYALAMRGHSTDFDEIRRLCGKFACDHLLDRKGQALEALGMTAMRQRRWNEAISCLYDSIRAPQRFYSNEDAMLKLAACLCNAGRQNEAVKWLEQLAGSGRTDIRGKAIQSIETLKRNPRAVLFLD